MRGFQMKGVDFDDSFSPTPGLAVGRFMLSLAVANDYELHACFTRFTGTHPHTHPHIHTH